MNSYVVLLTLEDAGMLTDLLQEKDEEEWWASVCACIYIIFFVWCVCGSCFFVFFGGVPGGSCMVA